MPVPGVDADLSYSGAETHRLLDSAGVIESVLSILKVGAGRQTIHKHTNSEMVLALASLIW